MARRMLLILCLLVLNGCTQYIYSGTIAGKDSAGKDRTFLVYWNKTERLLWFDTWAGAVRLLTECSLNDLVYEEMENGIIFQRRESDEGVNRGIPLKGPCGEIQNARQIKDLKEGALLLSVNCRPIPDEFSLTNRMNYPQAQDASYVFQVTKQKVADVENSVPPRPACRD